MDSIILRKEIRKVLPDYKTRYDHYSIVWRNFNANTDHGKQPESLIKRELGRMRHFKDYGVIASGNWRGQLIYFATSGLEVK